MQYVTSVSLSRSGDHRAKAGPNETSSSDLERRLFYSNDANPGLAKSSSPKTRQDPSDEAEARTYDIPPVEPGSFDGDVRDLPPVPIDLAQSTIEWESKLEEPETPIGLPENISRQQKLKAAALEARAAELAAPAPAPTNNFAGMGRFDPVTGGQAGAGSPPDTNGDVGPRHYIQSVNSSYAIYDKATGTRLAAFTENSLFSSGSRAGGGTGTGTLCDTNGFGDPVVLYDQLADRWILTNLAFVANATTGLWNPPLYQCFAASKTGDPVSGGWWVYAVRIDQGQVPVNTLHDYPKFGSWNDSVAPQGCLYMGANGFSGTTGTFTGPIFASFNKSDMYNGLALTGALGRIASTSIFSLFPTNLLGRAPNQLPPAGRPNYFVRNATTTTFGVRPFTPGANCGGGTLGAEVTVSHTSNGTVATNIVPQPNTTRLLDSLGDRLMQKNQYRKVGSAESVWVLHTARPTAGSNTRPQWAEINVTGGTVSTTPVQQGFHAPDTTLYRWMGSIAADTTGNMAMGYSTSNGTVPNFPSIAYAGRLVTDPLGTLPQTETQLIAGGGSQIFTCGGANCLRWGDYSSMSVDPVDDCTFWYTTEYYQTQAQGSNQPGIWQTRIGSFKFPSCVPITPVITCPASFTVTNDAGSCGAVVSFTGARAATATGNPTPTITYSPASGSTFPVGTTTVTATATNSFGSDSCTFTVTVKDTQKPTISCPADVVTSNDAGQCSAVVNYTVTSNDNCPGVTTSCSSPSGSTFPIGTTSVMCTSTDASGNTASCSFKVTVNDTEKPVISCPADMVVSNDPGQCSAVVNYSVTATDNCPGVTVVSSPPSGSTFPKGTTTVTSTATDAAGNTSSCTFKVTVNDTEKPVISCPADMVVSNDPGQCSAVVNYSVTATDNCPGVTVVSSPPSGSTFPKGTTTVTSTATDASGNTASCSFKVTVNDTEKPVISCPADMVVSNDPGQCTAVVNYSVTATDNCPGVTVVSSPPSGSTFPEGTTTVTSTATDASGNTSSCTFTVTVNDTEKPVISCPADMVVSTDPGQCSAVVNYSVTATDNCPGVTVVSSPPSGSTFPKGTTTVTSTATDAAGNISSCTFKVTVNDAEKPTITCPANIVTTNDPGQCSAVVTYSATATDNCPGVTVVSSPPSGSTFPKGTTTVTSTATDASGNTASCTFTVTVNDTEKPVITCPANIVTANDPGQCSAVVNYSVTARDNCPGVTVVSSPPSGSAFPKGTTTVTSTATDASGNTASCSFTVTVNDTEKPTIACPADMTVTQASNAGTVVNFVPASNDNCPGVTTSCTTAPGSTFPVGSTLVTCTATDTSGNTASCSFNVLVVPPSNPGGSFVIGDLDAVVGKHVTFWGSQWAKLNSLSGGSAPSSFKGFANSTTPFPPACGGTWNTDPGNSSGPPGSVPTFIAVMASSSITKSGSTITGNTRKMVIVRTDPGYAGNPGHEGTGTVIAVICQ